MYEYVKHQYNPVSPKCMRNFLLSSKSLGACVEKFFASLVTSLFKSFRNMQEDVTTVYVCCDVSSSSACCEFPGNVLYMYSYL